MAREYNSTNDTIDKARVTSLLSCDEPKDCPPSSSAAKFHLCRSFCQAAKTFMMPYLRLFLVDSS